MSLFIILLLMFQIRTEYHCPFTRSLRVLFLKPLNLDFLWYNCKFLLCFIGNNGHV